MNASAWAVEFIAQQLIGRAGRGTKTTMDTAAQNRIGLGDVFVLFIFICNLSLHENILILNRCEHLAAIKHVMLVKGLL